MLKENTTCRDLDDRDDIKRIILPAWRWVISKICYLLDLYFTLSGLKIEIDSKVPERREVQLLNHSIFKFYLNLLGPVFQYNLFECHLSSNCTFHKKLNFTIKSLIINWFLPSNSLFQISVRQTIWVVFYYYGKIQIIRLCQRIKEAMMTSCLWNWNSPFCNFFDKFVIKGGIKMTNYSHRSMENRCAEKIWRKICFCHAQIRSRSSKCGWHYDCLLLSSNFKFITCHYSLEQHFFC